MKTKFIVKDIVTKTYYCGSDYAWSKKAYTAHHFNSLTEAKLFIEQGTDNDFPGIEHQFSIKAIYIVRKT